MTGAQSARAQPSGGRAGADGVFVLRGLGLGDLLTAVPALRGLRRAFPGRRLVLGAAHPAAAWLRDLGLVDDVVPVSGADVVGGRGCPAFDGQVAVNLHGSGPQSHRWLLAGRPERLLAYANAEVEPTAESRWTGPAPAASRRPGEDTPPPGTRPDSPAVDLSAPVTPPAWDATEHEVLRWCRLVTATTGAPCGVDALPLTEAGARPPHDPRGRRWVVVHPGAASPARAWPLLRWAAIAGALSASGHRVLLSAGPGEEPIAHEIAYRAGLRDRLAVRSGLGLPGLAALLRSASLLVSPDTGVAHLANSLGTPSVTIFGPTPPDRWRPLIDPHRHAVVYAGDGTQRPSAPEHAGVTGPDATMLAVTVDDVLRAVDSVLSPLRV